MPPLESHIVPIPSGCSIDWLFLGLKAVAGANRKAPKEAFPFLHPLMGRASTGSPVAGNGSREALGLLLLLLLLLSASWFFPCMMEGQHIMAQVHIQTPLSSSSSSSSMAGEDSRKMPNPVRVAARERMVGGRLLDSHSLDGISQVYGASKAQEGRRATISSALELEGTVSHDGDLTHFVANNLQMKIKMSSRGSLDDTEPVSVRGKAADIPPIDPQVIRDLEGLTKDVAQKVDQMLRVLNSAIQNMTALSVGYIQTYRDAVDSLGESVDMSIKGMYTLMARCEELDRSMQPVHTLAKQIREIKRTLETFEAIYK